jgi:hypothetical protein
MSLEKFAVAEAALAQAAAAVTMRKRGLSRQETANALGVTGRHVWKIEYLLGLSVNSDEALRAQKIHPKSLKLV